MNYIYRTCIASVIQHVERMRFLFDLHRDVASSATASLHRQASSNLTKKQLTGTQRSLASAKRAQMNDLRKSLPQQPLNDRLLNIYFRQDLQRRFHAVNQSVSGNLKVGSYWSSYSQSTVKNAVSNHINAV